MCYRVALAVAALSLSLCLAELGLRLADHSPTSVYERLLRHNDPLLGYRMAPGDKVRIRGPEGSYFVHIGDLGFGDGRGFRDDGRGDAATSLFLGDSFVWGYGVSLEDAVSERYEAVAGGEALNLGMTAYTSPIQYARVFELYAPKLRAKHAFVGVYAGNDIEDNVLFDRWLQSSKSASYPEWRTLERRGVEGDDPISRLRCLGLRKSVLWSLVEERLLVRFAPPPGRDDHKEKTPEEHRREQEHEEKLMRDAFARIAQTGRSTGTRPVIFLIPTRGLVYSSDLPAETLPGENERLHAGLLELLRETGLPVLDLLPAFREAASSGGAERLYFKKDGHWTPAGHALAAAEIKRYVESLAGP